MSVDLLHPSHARQNGSHPAEMRSQGVREKPSDSILSNLTYHHHRQLIVSSSSAHRQLIVSHRAYAYIHPSQLIIIPIPAHPHSSSSSAQLINLLTYRLKCYLMVFHAPLAHPRISAG